MRAGLPGRHHRSPARSDRASRGWDISIQKIGIKAIGLVTLEVPQGCKLIIMAGLAGGLDPALKIGDLVASGGPDWVKLPNNIQQRKIVTNDHAVTTIAAKADLYAKTQAAVVDMETGTARTWAKSKGIDFIAIRAISDTARDAIDPRVLKLVDPYGRPRLTHVGSYILGNLLRIGSLMKLGKNSELAARNLGKAVRGVIEGLPPGPKSV